MRKLSKGQAALLAFLSNRKNGDLVNEVDLLKATEWKDDALGTYRRKHFLDPFLARVDGGSQYKVLRDGSDVTAEAIHAAFTQNKPATLVVARGTRLAGQSRAYELIERMGAGAVGEVWKASIASGTGEYVAAKIMNPRPDLLEPTRLTNVRDRFRLEAKNGSMLSHPNVITILDRGEHGGEPFVIMKLAEASTQDVLDRKGSISLEHSARIVSACVDALVYLHGLNLVHRDVKLPNILLCDDQVVLGDLGIVRWNDMNPSFTGAGTLTRGSMQLGSWFYMAPEQQEAPQDAVSASDIYALGITWYRFVTGKILTPAQIHAKKFAPLSNSDAVNNIMERMVRYEITERPQLDEIKSVLFGILKTKST